jgi:very-short-patch-repair endonuclease
MNPSECPHCGEMIESDIKSFIEHVETCTAKPLEAVLEAEKGTPKAITSNKRDYMLKPVLEAILQSPCMEEYMFHPVKRWRFDYAIPEFKLAFEIDGGLWLEKHGKKGGHSTGKGRMNDIRKDREAQILGWKVFRFAPEEIKSGRLLEFADRLKDSITEGQ